MKESEQAQATRCDEYWSLEQIIADGKEDDKFWESPEFDLFAVDSVRFYTQKRALIKYIDSQAQKIADLNRVGSNTLLALIEAQEKIAEQAKEIERLKQRIQDEYDAKAGF